MRPTRLAVPVITVLALAACSTTSHTSQKTTPANGSAVSQVVSAAAGGLVEGPSGAQLFVPAHVMSADGPVSITDLGNGTVDFHIGVPWSGQVQVRVPVSKDQVDQALLGHQRDGDWTVEDASYADGRVVAWVTSLSPFKMIKCLKMFAAGPEAGFGCLAVEGIKSIATTLLTKLGMKVTGQCGNVISIDGWRNGICHVGDPPNWHPPTQLPAPPANQPAPPRANQPAPQGGGNPPPPPAQQPQPQPQQPQPPHGMMLYDNYGDVTTPGHPMCRGNANAPSSMPGGEVTQTFTVPSGATAVTSALVQIDPGPVTVSARLFDGSSQLGSASTQAAGDTTFNFGRVAVTPGHTLTLVLDWSASAGTISTVYTVGAPGGTFHSSNSCPANHQSDTTGAGLRARISGLGY